MAPVALHHAIIDIKSDVGVHAFREDVGAIKYRIVGGEGTDTAGAIS